MVGVTRPGASIPFVFAVLLACSAWAQGPAADMAAVEEIGWDATAVPLRGLHYNARSFRCPVTADPSRYAVWGTGLYTDNSSICAAAVHAGVITGEGGIVTIQEMDGLENYLGTERNGIRSRDYGAWFFSFMFIPNP